MDSLAPLLLLLLLGLAACRVARSSDAFLRVDLERAARRVDARFLSVTVDAGLAARETFVQLLSSPRVRTLARQLAPAYVRFGGSMQDFLTFVPNSRGHPSSDPPCVEQELPPRLKNTIKEEWVLFLEHLRKREFSRANYSEVTVDLLNSFANCSGLDLIFGLNALKRAPDGNWDSSNAQLLLAYCESRGYNISWELGNEPNSYLKKAGFAVDPDQLGRDFLHLREILSESKVYHGAGLYGPDVSQPRPGRHFLLDRFLHSGKAALDACTWHHYYVDGREAALEDFIDPDLLDVLGMKINQVLEVVEAEAPGKPVWLGESGSAYGGGAPGLSDRFAAGFMWMDKLGLSAKLGLDVVMRQTLAGSGTYHLVDENLDPVPDYWLSVLYKRLVGTEVLDVHLDHPYRSRRIRLYMHCVNKRSYPEGGVTLMTMNLGWAPATVRLPSQLSNSTVDAFVLQSDMVGKEGLFSRSVMLNGDVLKMVDDRTLPPLTPNPLPKSDTIRLPGFSLAFYIFRQIDAAACH